MWQLGDVGLGEARGEAQVVDEGGRSRIVALALDTVFEFELMELLNGRDFLQATEVLTDTLEKGLLFLILSSLSVQGTSRKVAT